MLLLRHSLRLMIDVFVYARLNRAWWILPVVGLLLAAVAVASASQTAVPYAVYTLF